MSQNLPRCVISALRGGSGKTTITLGLIQGLKERGLKVAPFKKGPDYIDPFWHTEAAGHTCRNLDPYMLGFDQVRRSFQHYARGFDAAVVEGNRGLFDGKDVEGSFSTAALARELNAPAILVLDCTMTSRTVAAMVMGCQAFDKQLQLAGVILNPVANSRQEKVVRRAIEHYTGVSVLGAVPRLKLDMPERHMGLVPPQEHHKVSEVLGRIAGQVAAHVDLDAVMELMRGVGALPPQPAPEGLFPCGPKPVEQVPIAVIRDAAFGFYYAENLEALQNCGAELVFCSALDDERLPDCRALFIGGGFPETHAERLSANISFRDSVKAAADRGLPIYAECGGLMYLGRSIVVNGRKHEMAGIFPVDFSMHKKPKGHGYTACGVSGPNAFFKEGLEIKAHEFHYSQPSSDQANWLKFAYRVIRGKGIFEDKGGLIYKNVLGTYHHVHALGTPEWAPAILQAARRWPEDA
jgi:cobyrinic acid a,c-diamide synthase